MRANEEHGTLVIPYWPSAPWWPLLVTRQGTWNWFVTDCLNISPYDVIFITGSLSSNIFTAGVPPFELRALFTVWSACGGRACGPEAHRVIWSISHV